MILREPQSKQEWLLVQELVDEYAKSLDFDLCFQNYEEERKTLSQMYGPPYGGLILAFDEQGIALGCIGLRRFDQDVCEMKRLYVRPAARGMGAGKALVKAVIEHAEKLGYKQMLLDTVETMIEAQALYKQVGFKEVEPYRYNPQDGAKYFSLNLNETK